MAMEVNAIMSRQRPIISGLLNRRQQRKKATNDDEKTNSPCESCGNLIEVIHGGDDGDLVCCDDKIKLFKK